MIVAGSFLAQTIWADEKTSTGLSKLDALGIEPFAFLLAFIAIASIPFLAVLTTSFTKIVVVLSIARQAIGTAQTPPNIVIMSIAIILTGFGMYPVFANAWHNYQRLATKKQGFAALEQVIDCARKPISNYLSDHTKERDLDLFWQLAQKGQENPQSFMAIKRNDFIVLAPAFLLSELTLAFQIGFLIYLPFLVIDMTVANLLMALGMQMLAPTTISLPFKLLLFVLVDGWHLLFKGLAGG